MSGPVRVLVHGGSGRMGRALLARCAGDQAIQAVAAVAAHAPTAALTDHAGLLWLDSETLDAAPAFDVAVDFSVPDGFDRILALCVARGAALVSGTTGLSAAQHAAMETASARIPIVWASNFSIGAAVLARLAAQAARWLESWECDIAELHHSAKRDAPSGTALTLGQAVAAARGQSFDAVARVPGMADAGPRRSAADIGFASLRAGDAVGEHTVLFATAGERIELVHRATDRGIFARGALLAAQRLARRPAALYRLADLLDPDV